ncbi:hypothetical protein A3Q56_01952, partial [Intoshia linei]
MKPFFLLCVIFFNISFLQVCKIEIYNQNKKNQGIITEKNMKNSSICFFFISGKVSHRIHLEFMYYNLQNNSTNHLCRQNYIEIYQNLSNDSYIVEQLFRKRSSKRYCGVLNSNTMNSQKYISRSSQIALIVHYQHNSKFKIVYTFLNVQEKMNNQFVLFSNNDQCQYNIDGIFTKKGYILSPNYPMDYSQNMNCSYRIKCSNQDRIKVTFESINLRKIDIDAIKIMDETGKILDDKSISNGKHIYSTSNQININFQSLYRFDTNDIMPYNETVKEKRFYFKIKFSVSDVYGFTDPVSNIHHVKGT